MLARLCLLTEINRILNGEKCVVIVVSCWWGTALGEAVVCCAADWGLNGIIDYCVGVIIRNMLLYLPRPLHNVDTAIV